MNKKKANSFLQNTGYQLPQEIASKLSAYGYIIRQIDSNVNSKLLTFQKSRAATLLMSLRVQFPSDQQVHGSTYGNIAHFGKKVNNKFSVFKNPIYNLLLQAKIPDKKRMQNEKCKGECPKGLLPMPQVLHPI